MALDVWHSTYGTRLKAIGEVVQYVGQLEGCFVSTDGSRLKGTDKKHQYLCYPVLLASTHGVLASWEGDLQTARHAVLAGLKAKPFVVDAEFIKPGRKWEFINSRTLIDRVHTHCQSILNA